MSYSAEFMEYVASQMAGAGAVTYRLMFGAYGVYLDGKMFGIVGRNQLFVKPTEAGRAILPEARLVPPYEGASDYLLVDCIEDPELLSRFVRATVDELPLPKKRKQS